ncbi:adenosylcobinamide kinase / adenosylcobinamide-phosphate guanylyltransferase [Propionibacterium cyclohexanicum]|uniref:Adenosylcobinamide kinase n=1 Tax=Propionibacterium cyclohexanicum TaxID=64702 RepID=A0A1H9U0W3_9ACTN|nr:bifunctional adenosylcobinamide kinase/adenosylcobinamide-phosphate guanylyltransferase [Propionibacterium cyclohexanicum]SES02794.1 adenosylcobinamide kinase / adenosylcobinamide-phosphate guanylyltransferase [Propionibacterium cyclohexanicum]
MPQLRIDIPDDPQAWALVERLRELGARPAPAQRTLVTGGARSGKSSRAEQLLASHDAVDYVATSARNEHDPEWMARIAAHRARRPDSWRTLETLDIADVLATPGPPVLVDCLGVWLTRVLDKTGFWDDPGKAAQPVDERIGELVRAVASTTRRVVLVTNEVGCGVVPATESGRAFRDRIGILNASVADVCDEVLLCVAGRAVSLPR